MHKTSLTNQLTKSIGNDQEYINKLDHLKEFLNKDNFSSYERILFIQKYIKGLHNSNQKMQSENGDHQMSLEINQNMKQFKENIHELKMIR